MPVELYRRRDARNIYIRGTVRGQRVYESTGTDDQRVAEEIRIKREAQLLEESVHGKRATVTFFECAVSYMERGGSPRFLGTRRDGRWTGLLGVFERKRLNEITQADLDRAADKLLPDGSAETRNRQVYTPFIAVWNHGISNQWAEARKWSRPRRPRGTIHRLKPVRAGTRPVSYDRAATFVQAMSPAPAIVMTVLFYTGMRPIELFALRADEVDIKKRWIALPSSKTGEPRGVPMHDVLVPLLTCLVERGEPLFRTPRNDPYPLLEDGGGQLNSAIRGARRRTGILEISAYTARHTLSTQLVLNGIHPHIKDQILGHAVDDMSRRYTHVPQAHLIEAINTLPIIPAWASAPWMTDVRKYARKLVPWSEEARKRHSATKGKTCKNCT